MPILVALFGCTRSPEPQDAVDHLVRASMALRGIRPTPAEIAAVAEDPSALPVLARAWLSSDAFGATLRDMHAEQLSVRTDTHWQLSPTGPLAGTTEAERALADEEPLALVEWIVRSGRPYTDIVTTDVVLADPRTAEAYGIAIADPNDPSWQVGYWLDGRPAAGILSSTTLWQRFTSSDTNHHRGRANFVLSTLLCDPLPQGAVASDPDIEDLSQAPACAGCHLRLDPLASAFFGFERYVLAYETSFAYNDLCEGDQAKYCYPLQFWDESMLDDSAERGMPPAALDGIPLTDVADLGQLIAADPRFASCTARRFGGYLTQTPTTSVSDEDVTRWAEILVGADFDVRELALAIVLDPSFAPATGTVHPQLMRAEQLDRTLDALVGYTWGSQPADGYGAIRFATSDEYGFRSLLGGMNGWDSTRPDHHPMPTRELAMAWAASEAAAWAVDRGIWPPGGIVAGDDEVRAALIQMHTEILAELSPDIEPTFSLWKDSIALTGDPSRAWKIVGTALLLDHDVVMY